MNNVDIMHDYIENNLSRSNLMKKYNLTTSTVNSLTNRFHPTVTFDSKKLFDTIKNDLLNLTITVFLKKYVVNFEKTLELKNGGTRITYKKLITWLKMLNMPYELTFKEVSQSNSKLTIRVNIDGYVEPDKEIKIEKRGQVYMMTPEEQKDFNLRMRLLKTQRNALMEKLAMKGIAATVRTTIEETIKVIEREAITVGRMAEMNGYGDKAIYEILKQGGMR